MANSQQARKRIRQNERRRLQNRYKLVKSRNMVKRLMKCETKQEADALLLDTISSIDKLAKSNIIHKNKAARQKSQLIVFYNELG